AIPDWPLPIDLATRRLINRSPLARHQHPVVEIEHHRRMRLALTVHVREVGTRLVLRCDRTEAQGADIAATPQRRFLLHFAPGIDRVAGKGRADMPAAIDGGNAAGVAEAVEAQGARQADDVTPIDDATAEAAAL